MDKHLRQRWKEMVITSHFGKHNKARATNPSPLYQIGSHAKESDKRKQRRKRRKRAGTTTRQGMGSSGGDFTTYEDGGSTEEEDNNESKGAKVEIVDSEESGSSGFFVFFPKNDCAGTIDSMIGVGEPINPQSLC
jgi:hypothetical protein